ncbi:uncharacterized protein LOC109821119 [Asparagus officinalis]|uniref:uncharacterized protein LOC109821119 n=1 Tax=Asparagus officinalis TaxID=4686 RepID=UPI00098E03FD|nr:uncharacterized protein LOC109821119 [Asparagus officinalis]
MYIGQFRIVECIGAILYRLDLPVSMSSIHDIFNVLMLNKCLHNEVRILAKKDKRLRNKVIHLVKVQWNRKEADEASWECEEDIHRDYPHLLEQALSKIACNRLHKELVEWQVNPTTGYKHKIKDEELFV